MESFEGEELEFFAFAGSRVSRESTTEFLPLVKLVDWDDQRSRAGPMQPHVVPAEMARACRRLLSPPAPFDEARLARPSLHRRGRAQRSADFFSAWWPGG